MMEAGTPNGHKQPVSPLKRVLMRNVPELTPELQHVVNVFDPWGRDRGQYYSLEWKPRPDAASRSCVQAVRCLVNSVALASHYRFFRGTTSMQ